MSTYTAIHHQVCPICGGRLVERYLDGKYRVQCGNDAGHDVSRPISETTWIRRQNEAALEAIDVAIAYPTLAGERRDVDDDMKDLFGEGG